MKNNYVQYFLGFRRSPLGTLTVLLCPSVRSSVRRKIKNKIMMIVHWTRFYFNLNQRIFIRVKKFGA